MRRPSRQTTGGRAYVGACGVVSSPCPPATVFRRSCRARRPRCPVAMPQLGAGTRDVIVHDASPGISACVWVATGPAGSPSSTSRQGATLAAPRGGAAGHAQTTLGDDRGGAAKGRRPLRHRKKRLANRGAWDSGAGGRRRDASLVRRRWEDDVVKARPLKVLGSGRSQMTRRLCLGRGNLTRSHIQTYTGRATLASNFPYRTTAVRPGRTCALPPHARECSSSPSAPRASVWENNLRRPAAETDTRSHRRPVPRTTRRRGEVPQWRSSVEARHWPSE